MARVRAPELPQDLPWLNCDRSPLSVPCPLSLKALRGRVVILDFWTYGCINCLHVLPDLHDLAQAYADGLTIIGVHTPKFDHERSLDSVQQAIWRYNIHHPVLVDRDRQVWDQYAIRAWPTFVVIDPQGYVVASIAGEGQRPVLDTWVRQLTAAATGGNASLAEFPPIVETPQFIHPLAFPGKVLADEPSDTLFIADTGHHRIVVTTLEGTLKGVIGTGTSGWVDGASTIAQFASPQGMALDRTQQILYVADTGNHLIRQIALSSEQVSTLAGTGNQNRSVFPQGGQARTVDLNSPWDVVLVGDILYVAMAGSHQIWALDRANGTAQTWLGTGAEACVDGGVDVAAFAQPSGIATDGQTLFVADSEGSAIRAATLDTAPTVQTICGSGQLFEFGDRDGGGEDVRLQHCLGIAWDDRDVWIADTYNHRIKHVNPTTKTCRTVCGSGKAGPQNGVGTAANFAEPAGLSLTSLFVYVADTNNHAIRRIQRDSLTVSTVTIPTLCSPFVCLPDRSP